MPHPLIQPGRWRLHQPLKLRQRTVRMRNLPREICPDRKIAREIASRRSLRLWPLYCGIDEVQNLFTSRYAKQAKEDAEFCAKIGPAFGVNLILATQRPDAASLAVRARGDFAEFLKSDLGRDPADPRCGYAGPMTTTTLAGERDRPGWQASCPSPCGDQARGFSGVPGRLPTEKDVR